MAVWGPWDPGGISGDVGAECALLTGILPEAEEFINRHMVR